MIISAGAASRWDVAEHLKRKPHAGPFAAEAVQDPIGVSLIDRLPVAPGLAIDMCKIFAEEAADIVAARPLDA